MPADSALTAIGLSTDLTFDSGAVAVPTGASYTPIGKIQNRGGPLLLRRTVGAGAGLGHLKIVQSTIMEGTLDPLAIDAAIVGGTGAIPYVLTSGANLAYQTLANGSFQILIVSYAAAIGIYAQADASGNPTTLQISGTAYPIIGMR